MTQIGRCPSCQNLFCETQKVKRDYPHLGCAEWTTAEAAKSVRELKQMKIVKAKNDNSI